MFGTVMVLHNIILGLMGRFAPACLGQSFRKTYTDVPQSDDGQAEPEAQGASHLYHQV